jgi:hypothetical protein
MRSECMAAVPHSMCSYTWKMPVTHQRPALFEHAQESMSPSAGMTREAEKVEHPSIPWKAYLATREFQNLASDLADAVFSASPNDSIPDRSVPTILTRDPRDLPGAAVKPLRGVLASVLPADAGAMPQSKPGREPLELAAAA